MKIYFINTLSTGSDPSGPHLKMIYCECNRHRMERPSTDEYFMEMARLVSTRSTCLRRKVGAVIVKDKRVLSTGYNGSPRGTRHCEEMGTL